MVMVSLPRRALSLAILLATGTAGTAAADGLYLSEGIGVTRIDDELGDTSAGDDDALHVRGALGYRRGHFAVELWIRAEIPMGFAGQPAGDARAVRPDRPAIDAPVAYGLDAKFIQPLTTHLEAYARAGLSRLQVGDYAGRGFDAAAGLQIGGKVSALGFLWWPLFFLDKGPKVHAALWFEGTSSFYRVRADNAASLDARLTGWTLGLSLGQDF